MESKSPENVLSVSTPTSPNRSTTDSHRIQTPPLPRGSSQRTTSSHPAASPESAERALDQIANQPADIYSIPEPSIENNVSSARERPRFVTPSAMLDRTVALQEGSLSPPRQRTSSSTGRPATPTPSGTSPGRSLFNTLSPMPNRERSSNQSTSSTKPNSPGQRLFSPSSSASETPLSPGRQVFCQTGTSKSPRTLSTASSHSSSAKSTPVNTASRSLLQSPPAPPEIRRGTSALTTLSAEQEQEDATDRLEPLASNSLTRNFEEFRDHDGVQLSDMYGPFGGGNGESDKLVSKIESERSRRNRASDVPPPVSVVTVRSSGEEGEVSTRDTKVLVRSHHVPLSPNRSDHSGRRDGGLDASSALLLGNGTELQEADAKRAPLLPQNPYPFDTEENCLIGDTGIDSEYGRVHIPSSWAKAGLVLDEDDPEQRQREIMVTRPWRISDSSGSSERRVELELSHDRSSRERSKADSKPIEYDTGNKERDEIMRRAKAFIEAFEDMDFSDDAASLVMSQYSRNEELDGTGADTWEDSLQAEDGLAKLGGDWMSSSSRGRCTMEAMEADPSRYLPEIYEEACKKLNRDNVDGALSSFKIILRCQKEKYGAVHEHTAAALYNVGIAHLRGQNGQEALGAFEEATQVRRAVLWREHRSVAVALVKVGITNLLLRRFEEALWNFREALSVRKRALGPHHPSTARIYNNIGCVHVEFNELREARRAFETALEIQRNTLSNDPDSRGIMLATATTLCNLGYLYRHRELNGKAALVLREAADLQEIVLGSSNPAVLSTLDCLADSCANGGQTTDALRFYNIILTRYRVGGAPNSQTVLRAESVLLYKMSRAHRQRNDRESQLDTLKLALRSVRALSDAGSTRKDALERRIIYDMRSCREHMDKNKIKRIEG